MTKLQYTFKTDTLFKILFTKFPDLLKELVAALLGIAYESIEQFDITNPNISPEELGKKFCRLDIKMTVNGQVVDLEIQVADEGNYPDRSLYYWAREFSTCINEGDDYSLLSRTIVISILGFNQFPDPQKFHTEFQCLEVTTHELLTDKMILHFYELNKLPPLNKADSGRDLWLKLFRAETEEELTKIDGMGVPIMSEAISAYRHVAASPELREAERMRSKARHDEAQALMSARLTGKSEGAEEERKKWQGVAAENEQLNTENEELRRQLAKLRAQQDE